MDVKVSTTSRVGVPVAALDLGHVLECLERMRAAGVPETAHIALNHGWGDQHEVAASWLEPSKDGTAGFMFAESIRETIEYLASGARNPEMEAEIGLEPIRDLRWQTEAGGVPPTGEEQRERPDDPGSSTPLPPSPTEPASEGSPRC